MCRITVATLAVVSTLAFGTWPAWVQEIPKTLQGENTEQLMKDRINSWMPIITRGVPANLDDLLYLRGVDIAVAQSDAFEYFRTNRKINNLNKRVNYILRFPIAEVQVIARPEIRSLEDLRGKRVDFGPPGTSTTLTTPLIFQRLGINVQEVKLPNPFTPAAYQRIAKGEADAAVRVSQKPLSHVAQIPPNSGLHLVSIPFNKVFADLYAIGEFTHEDYPNLVPEGQRVDTLAVPFVLAAYNWPKDSDRYRKVERFVVKLFENWEKLRQPPFAAKWRDINLAATVPGWSRLPAAEEQLAKLVGGQASARQDFQAFLSSAGVRRTTNEEREALFLQFLEWREQRGGGGRAR